MVDTANHWFTSPPSRKCPLVLTTHVRPVCLWASSQANPVSWNQVPSCHLWTATDHSLRFCFFLLLLIFRADSSLRNIATFGIVESPASLCALCCCFLSASVKMYLALRVIDRPLSFHGNFLHPFISTSVNISSTIPFQDVYYFVHFKL